MCVESLRSVFAFFQENDRELERYVNQVVDASIVPILSLGENGSACPVPSPSFPSVAGELRYVSSGVCRELHGLQRDPLFGVQYTPLPTVGKASEY
jgi:hypothetical protein